MSDLEILYQVQAKVNDCIDTIKSGKQLDEVQQEFVDLL